MARPRKKPVAPPQTPTEAIALALKVPFESFGVMAGAADRFGAEAVALAVLDQLSLATAGGDDSNEAGLAILLAQTGAPGEVYAELGRRIEQAFASDAMEGAAWLLPVACAGIPLAQEWVEPLPRELRHSLAAVAVKLAGNLEPLLAFHGAMRLTPIEETVRVLKGE